MRFTRWTLVILIAVVAAIATYEWLNTAISLNYARQQQKVDESDADILRKIVLARNLGRPCSEVEVEMRRNFDTGHLIKRQEGTISIDDVVFSCDANHLLSKIQFMSRPE